MQPNYPGEADIKPAPASGFTNGYIDQNLINNNPHNYPHQQNYNNQQFYPNNINMPNNLNYNNNIQNPPYNPNPQMNYQQNAYANPNMMPNMRGNPNCAYCRGTGIIYKKKKTKPCKHCDVNNPYKRQTWCGCFKVNKKGHKKCKISKHACEIL